MKPEYHSFITRLRDLMEESNTFTDNQKEIIELIVAAAYGKICEKCGYPTSYGPGLECGMSEKEKNDLMNSLDEEEKNDS